MITTTSSSLIEAGRRHPFAQRSQRPAALLRMRANALPVESAITREARRGYDLLILGITNTVAAQGGFHEDVARIASVHDGPLAVVVARGEHIAAPEGGTFKHSGSGQR